MSTSRVTMLLMALILLLPSVRVQAAEAEVQLYIVSDYRYEVVPGKGDPVIGQSLCGTRCNALSTNYLNIVEPGAWRLIKIATGYELSLPLNNPFMGGRCICVVDEYMVKVDTLNKPSDKHKAP